jgi:hypothetical protein
MEYAVQARRSACFGIVNRRTKSSSKFVVIQIDGV